MNLPQRFLTRLRRGSAQTIQAPVDGASTFSRLRQRVGPGRLGLGRTQIAVAAVLLTAPAVAGYAWTAHADYRVVGIGIHDGIDKGCTYGGSGPCASLTAHYGATAVRLNEPVGDFLLTGNGLAYCVQIQADLDYQSTYHLSDNTALPVSWILFNEFPRVQNAPGRLPSNDDEAAAVQLAIWRWTDGVTINGGVPAADAARADAIYAASQNAHAPRAGMTLSASPTQTTAPGSVQITATVVDEIGNAVPGVAVSFTASGGQLGAAASTTDGAGHAVTTVTDPGPGTVTVNASGQVNVTNGLKLIADRPSQQLVLASPIGQPVSASTSATFVGTPSLHISKAATDVSTGTPAGTQVSGRPGDEVKWTLTVTNTGNANAPGVVVTDDLTPNAQNNLAALADVTPASGTMTGHVATFAIGTVAAGGTATVTLDSHVARALNTASTTICNTASVQGAGIAPVGSNPACAVVTAQAKVVSSKLVNNVTHNTANLDDLLTYDVTVTNTGTQNLTNVVVSDPLTSHNLTGLTNVTVKNGGTYDATKRMVMWTVATLNVGTSATVEFTANIPGHLDHGVTTSFCNTAYVRGPASSQTNQVCTDVTPKVCPVAAPTVTLTGPAQMVPGGSVTYSATAKNSGTPPLSNVQVVIVIPAGLTVTATSLPPASTSGATYTFSVGTLAPGASAPAVTITATVPDAMTGAITATATTTGTDATTQQDCGHDVGNVTATPVESIFVPNHPTTPPAAPVAPPPPPAQAGQVQGITLTAPETGASDVIHRATIGGGIILAGLWLVGCSIRRRRAAW